jgi:hypothetical protein
MNDEEEAIHSLEIKATNLSTELLSSSFHINDDFSKIRKDFYKSLLIALRIIQKQKEEIIDLRLSILEKDDEIKKKDIMRFCLT